eukprot:TRINITY_DN5632_c0_g1_i1.p1 TRINITY_DN5632_c0_g1~~TRINITY_DN5632_c0_g1_i1.p1  ORF type:complete len:339 (+),score=24.24 TRINITY_DN5632_c0_g1_i1:107-1123(+)
MEGGGSSDQDNRGKTEQVLRECFLKVTQSVLQSRIPLPLGRGKANKWFNLELEELDSITEELHPWRSHLYTPLYINIIFISRDNERLLQEQWKLSFEQSFLKTNEAIEIPTLYKKIVLLIRTLFSHLRLMPAFKLFRACSKNKLSQSKMVYELRKDDYVSFPISERPDELRFDAIQTAFGRLTLSALYTQQYSVKQLIAPNQSVINSQYIISDYAPQDIRDISSTSPTGLATSPTGLATSPISGLSSRDRSVSNPIPIGMSKPIGIPRQEGFMPAWERDDARINTGAFSPPASITTAIPLATPPSRVSIDLPLHLNMPPPPPFANLPVALVSSHPCYG